MQQTVDRGTIQRLGTVVSRKTLGKLDRADRGYVEKVTTEITHGGGSQYDWVRGRLPRGRMGGQRKMGKGTSGEGKGDRECCGRRLDS